MMPDNTEISTYSVKNSVVNARGKTVLFTPKQKKFLEVLAEGGDDVAAAKAAGYKNLSEAMESDIVAAEMVRIQAAWSYEVRMNARFASGEHMRLMEKFENQYDESNKDDKPKMAGVLAKMSDTSLKASGKMNPMNGSGASMVNVQINIGSKKQEIVIDGESSEVDS